MRKFESILAVIPTTSRVNHVTRFVRNALEVGDWLGSDVHFLAQKIESERVQSLVADFKKTKPHAPSVMIIHPTVGSPSEQIRTTIEKFSCSLVLLGNGAGLTGIGDSERRRILESSPSPVLILPGKLDFARQRPEALLVPLSGESRMNRALVTAMDLAAQTQTSVDLLHVTSPAEPCNCEQTLEALGDELYHEYGSKLDQIAAEANPYSTAEQRSRIRHFYHATGFRADEITAALERSGSSILVLEWRGTLARGRAKTIKEILGTVQSPLLFVRAIEEQKSRLRVGKQMRAA